MKLRMLRYFAAHGLLTNINDAPHVKCLIANCGKININIDMDGLERTGDIYIWIRRWCHIDIINNIFKYNVI